MKSAVKLVMGLVFVATVLMVARAYAETAPATPPSGSTASQRLQQRKQERKVQIDAKDRKRLTERCAVAQDKLSQLKSSSNQSFINRQKEYQYITADVWIAIGKLKLADKDTFQLEKQLTALTGKINAFQTVVVNYQQTLDDTIVLNCQADIEGFKALLDTSRLYYTDLIARSKDVRTYVTDTIKTSLTTHLNELQSGGGN